MFLILGESLNKVNIGKFGLENLKGGFFFSP